MDLNKQGDTEKGLVKFFREASLRWVVSQKGLSSFHGSKQVDTLNEHLKLCLKTDVHDTHKVFDQFKLLSALVSNGLWAIAEHHDRISFRVEFRMAFGVQYGFIQRTLHCSKKRFLRFTFTSFHTDLVNELLM